MNAGTTCFHLLSRARQQDEQAWRRFDGIYGPFIEGWLVRQDFCGEDAADIRQEVMAKLQRALPDFEHHGRLGAFRKWLRVLTTNHLRTFQRRPGPQMAGGQSFSELADLLEDPNNSLRQEWDTEFAKATLKGLLAAVHEQFKPSSIKAFREVFLQGRRIAEVAQELNMTPSAVRVAVSRVLKEMRTVGEELME